MRLKSGYKQEDLAELVGLKQNSFSDYERGSSSPSFETVVRIEPDQILWKGNITAKEEA